MSNPDKIEQLIKSYCDGVVRHRENMYSNHAVANQNFVKFRAAFRKLLSCGEPGLSALAKLLENPRPVVRIVTAMYLISFYPEKAVTILQTELGEGGRLSPEALVTLEKWKRGTYIDPFTGKDKTRSDLSGKN